jgi:hypothetical protein
MLTVKVRLVDKNVNSHVGKVMVRKAMNQKRRLGKVVKTAKIKPAAEVTDAGSVPGDRDGTTCTVVFCKISRIASEAFEAISVLRAIDDERLAASNVQLERIIAR